MDRARPGLRAHYSAPGAGAGRLHDISTLHCPGARETLEQLLPLCKRTLYETAKAKVDSGAAYSQRDAARQIAEETGRPIGTVREYIRREETARKPDTMWPPCEKGLQEEETDTPICAYCRHYDVDKHICWQHRTEVVDDEEIMECFESCNELEEAVRKAPQAEPEKERTPGIKW